MCEGLEHCLGWLETVCEMGQNIVWVMVAHCVRWGKHCVGGGGTLCEMGWNMCGMGWHIAWGC